MMQHFGIKASFFLFFLVLSTPPTNANAPDNILTLFHFPEDDPVVGKCLDGTQAGFYIRRGTNPKLFMIDLKGGGSCVTKESCDSRARQPAGSSNRWEEEIVGGNTLHEDCRKNPDFCEATAIFVPNCTGDQHLGTRSVPTTDSFGYTFTGRTNMKLLIGILKADYGLNDAEGVLLTGSSAGAHAAYLTVDWLAEQVPNAVVKAAPRVGWFYPGALQNDIPDEPRVPPSTYPYFKEGTYGNANYQRIVDGTEMGDPWLMEPIMNEDCVRDNSDNPQVCTSLHVLYKHIKSSLYVIQPHFDQVHGYGEAPERPTPEDVPVDEVDIFKDYVTMWGDSWNATLTQITDGVIDQPKPHPDGLFSASCMKHGAPQNVLVDGYKWLDILGDWFFQRKEYEAQYHLIERCPGGDNSLPCNRYLDECRIPAWMRDPTLSPSPVPTTKNPTSAPTMDCKSFEYKGQCRETEGCTWYSNFCVPCSPFESKTLCREAGCYWNLDNGTCFSPPPSPTSAPTSAPTLTPTSSPTIAPTMSCLSVKNKSNCRAASACFWYPHQKYGEICVDCFYIPDASRCRQAGCAWKSNEQQCS